MFSIYRIDTLCIFVKSYYKKNNKASLCVPAK